MMRFAQVDAGVVTALLESHRAPPGRGQRVLVELQEDQTVELLSRYEDGAFIAPDPAPVVPLVTNADLLREIEKLTKP